ncbi:MAG: hypothetical protein AAGG07_07270 [Planctomycetota bacterium]
MNHGTRMHRGAAAAGLVSMVILAGGCVVAIGNGSESGKLNRVSTSEMDELVRAQQTLEIGMSKDEVISGFDTDLVTLMSSARYEGRDIEEWRVYAYDKRRKVRFQRWVYFVDGKLVQFGDERVEYEQWEQIRQRWASEFQPA